MSMDLLVGRGGKMNTSITRRPPDALSQRWLSRSKVIMPTHADADADELFQHMNARPESSIGYDEANIEKDNQDWTMLGLGKRKSRRSWCRKSIRYWRHEHYLRDRWCHQAKEHVASNLCLFSMASVCVL